MNSPKSINYPKTLVRSVKDLVMCEKPLCLEGWVRVNRISVTNGIEITGRVREDI